MTTNESRKDVARELLANVLGQPHEHAVFPWQHTLLDSMLRGELPSALDLPTGLGKTSVIAIWLVARILRAPVPRRLVYVVDRRAVVDQATSEAERLRSWLQNNVTHTASLELDDRPMPISTLRGQHVDNREWLEDPSLPAIIVGTVDMIGSRLLFEGYGASRKIRPYHAALLACDSLFVIDEAHIIPTFESLVASIPPNSTLHATAPSANRDLPPRMHVLALSATQRTTSSSSFTLSTDDINHPVVAQRLRAKKNLSILAPSSGRLADDLVDAAWNLHQELRTPITCIVFCDTRETAVTVEKELRKRGKSKFDVELFVGARRVVERVEAENRLRDLGFVAGQRRASNNPRFLVATSAAEVGVDLDAEHLVCDVVAWERMVQRFGRVNRRGEHPAELRIVTTPSDSLKKQLDGKKKDAEDEAETTSAMGGHAERYHATLQLLQNLPAAGEHQRDASPSALRHAASDHQALVQKATTPAPLRPALDRATLDAWAMTSLPEHSARPLVAPWLRGWVDDEPRVSLVWRRYLPQGESWSDDMQKTFVEAAPPHTSETLDIEMRPALSWLKERVAALVEQSRKSESGITLQSMMAVALNAAGERIKTYTLADLILDEKTEKEAKLARGTSRGNLSHLERDDLPNATLIVDARIGGLVHGLLDPTSDEPVKKTADGEGSWLDLANDVTNDEPPLLRFRMDLRPEHAPATDDPNWRERLRLPWKTKADGDVDEWLVIDKWRHDAATEEDRSAGRPQLLHEHQAWTAARAIRLGKRLGLSARAIELLAIAARLHDEGKRAERWQRAMRAPKGDIYAKTRGPVAPALLDGYRHEFGSLPYVQKDADFQRLPDDDKDLVLHLVAAHHGFARPVINVRGADDAPPSLLQARAQEIALRYMRLSERWGPWGLAWWESLLRAADQQASRENDDPTRGARS